MTAGRKGEAFTLVELLVVISIIALLMAILVPALQRGRGKAREVWCMNTLRNFSLAYRMYLHETGRYLPVNSKNPYTPWYNNDLFRQGIALSLLSREQKERRYPQIQEWAPNFPRKFICPAASYALDHPEEGLYPIDRSYGVNVDGDQRALSLGLGDLSDKEGWVKRPSEKLFMADALDWWIGYAFCRKYSEFGEDWIGYRYPDGGTYGMTAYRHYDRVNIMFWDGHCGRLSSEEVARDPNHLWNPLN